MKAVTPAKVAKMAKVMRELGIARLRTPELELELFPEQADITAFDAGGDPVSYDLSNASFFEISEEN